MGSVLLVNQGLLYPIEPSIPASSQFVNYVYAFHYKIKPKDSFYL